MRSALKDKSYDCTDSPSMNMFSEPGIRLANGGFDCFMVTRVDEMLTLFKVSAIMLAKPTTITQMIERESSPPVKVLYWVSEL